MFDILLELLHFSYRYTKYIIAINCDVDEADATFPSLYIYTSTPCILYILYYFLLISGLF